MRWKNGILALSLASGMLPATAVLAADHRDGAAVLADPSTDVNDVYSWVSSDGSKLYLIMTVLPAADKAAAKFSTAAYYVFHTASRSAFGSTAATPLDVICSFDDSQRISCWVGDNSHFVSGDASNPAGITGSDNQVKVFAGVRKDHFFFNLDGFNNVRSIVKSLSPVPTADTNGCFAQSAANTGGLTPNQTALVAQRLTQNPTGGAATDFFLPLNTLAIVMEIDKALLTTGGQYFSVWGATHKKQ